MGSIHSNFRKLIEEQTRKAGVLLLVEYHREPNTPLCLHLTFRLVFWFHWASYCNLLLSLGFQCISVGQWNLLKGAPVWPWIRGYLFSWAFSWELEGRVGAGARRQAWFPQQWYKEAGTGRTSCAQECILCPPLAFPEAFILPLFLTCAVVSFGRVSLWVSFYLIV